MKRVLSLLLAAALMVSLVPAALAADAGDEKATVLAALEIMCGDENGDLHLERTISRAEFAKMAVTAHPTGRYAAEDSAVSPFYDVPSTHWAAGYIATAADLGLMKGRTDGLFHPDELITLEEAATVLLALLGYTADDLPGAYPSPQLTAYRSLGLNEGVAASRGDTLTRGDCQQLFYNLMTTKSKTTGQAYILSLNAAGLTASGDLDTVALVNDAMEGPIVAGTDWQSKVGFTVNGSTTVYRAGRLSNSSAVSPYDLLYYSAALRTVWAYTDRVTGTYTAASPSLASPDTVEVAGKTYQVETSAAKLALSDLGGARLGDTVTLLLGRTGGVAAVLTGGEVTSTLAGVVTQVGTGSYTDENGHNYTAETVTLLATDGGTYTYPAADKNSLEAGDLAQVTFSGGEVRVSGLSGSTVSGRVSSDGERLGSTPFADDVQILDVYEAAGLRVYPSRLAGATLNSGDVRYCGYNASGEIDRLILDDYTGDLHQYAVLTEIDDRSSELTILVNYTYLLNGQETVYPSSGTKFSVSTTGPVQIQGGIDRMVALKQVTLTSARDGKAWNGSQEYLLADNAAVYELRDGAYYLSSLDRVSDGSYKLTGYYDKEAVNGGRIRVIVAR